MQDVEYFCINWIDQFCSRGVVQITMFSLSYNVYGPTTRTHRTMLFWFIKVSADHETLKTTKYNT